MCGTVLLRKTLEYMRQEVRGYPDSSIADAEFNVRIHSLQEDLDFSALRSEFDSVAQEIPKYLLQASRIPRNDHAFWIENTLQSHAFVLRRGLYRVEYA